MPKLRFVHAADLHLDSPFRGIRAQAPENVAQTLHRATFDAFENIINLCIREQVDALLVAGDVYDGADRSLRAQLKFVDGLKQLDSAGIRSFICHGNHDPLDGWEARLDLPAGCVRFGPDVTAEPVFPDEPQRATVYGISYPRREVRENLSPLFRQVVSGSGFNIGLLHANVGGDPNHDSYSPCSVADLEIAPIDYWALGHVHTRQALREQGPAVVYPGNPQGRHPGETGARGVYLVEVEDSGPPRLEFHAMDVVRWETLSLDIAGLETEQALIDAVSDRAESALEASEGRPVVFRLALAGRGTMHRWLRREDTVDDLLEQLNSRYANSNPWLWCERIQLDTASPVDREQAARREDFTGDLARLCTELRENPEALVELQESLQELYGASRARRYLNGFLPDGPELLEILTAAEAECLAELVGEEDEA